MYVCKDSAARTVVIYDAIGRAFHPIALGTHDLLLGLSYRVYFTKKMENPHVLVASSSFILIAYKSYTV